MDLDGRDGELPPKIFNFLNLLHLKITKKFFFFFFVKKFLQKKKLPKNVHFPLSTFFPCFLMKKTHSLFVHFLVIFGKGGISPHVSNRSSSNQDRSGHFDERNMSIYKLEPKSKKFFLIKYRKLPPLGPIFHMGEGRD
jgi:hypothetical protein